MDLVSPLSFGCKERLQRVGPTVRDAASVIHIHGGAESVARAVVGAETRQWKYCETPTNRFVCVFSTGRLAGGKKRNQEEDQLEIHDQTAGYEASDFRRSHKLLVVVGRPGDCFRSG